MRFALTGLALAIGLGCAVAVAQTEPDAPIWAERPQARHVERAYPRKAIQKGWSGIGVLCCVPRDDGSLSCALAAEWPDRRGFGAAALKVSEHYRMTPEAVATLRAKPDPIPYRLSLPMTLSPSEDDQAGIAQVARDTSGPDFCRGRGPAS
jgi:hypothetical protein